MDDHHLSVNCCRSRCEILMSFGGGNGAVYKYRYLSYNYSIDDIPFLPANDTCLLATAICPLLHSIILLIKC